MGAGQYEEEEMSPVKAKAEVKPELSLKEKERRWSLVCKKLNRAGYAALIVMGAQSYHDSLSKVRF